MKQSTAVLVCGHGSRDPAAISEFDRLAAHLGQRLSDRAVGHAYLEFARPAIGEGLEALRARGASRIVCQPGMLLAAGQVKNDLPSEIHDFGHAHPEVELLYGRELAVEARLLQAAAERIEAAEAAAPSPVPRAESLLLVIGRGTRDPDANGDVAKVARMLWEGLGFGWAEVGFSGVTQPSGDVALAQAVKLGYRRIIVFPYFLFTGVLVRRIYDWVDAAAARWPQIQILKASYLNDHPLVIETFLERIEETLAGKAAMNCSLCKYRTPILGHEDEQGAPQAGHHHHVRGIGVGSKSDVDLF